MEIVDRRDCLKGILTGLAVLSTGGVSLSALPDKKGPGPRDFWKRVDQSKTRDLVESAIKAAQAQIESQRAINASQRAAILLGGDAGKEHLTRAHTHYQARTAALGQTKQALARFVKNSGDAGEKRFTEFVGKGGLKELAAHARQTSIEALMNSDVSPDEARSAVKALDDRLGKVQGMNSFRDMTSYLDQHLDELIERKMPEEDPNGLCILILILFSIFAVLVVIAVLICIFTLGFGCQGILDQLLAQSCP